ncbi:MAG TPA: hypothetical protein VF116_22680 [Ktedonobacterales bacterium]
MLTTTTDSEMPGDAQAQIAEALRDLQVRLHSAPPATGVPAVPVPDDAAALFAQAADEARTSEAMFTEAERLNALLARTRAAGAAVQQELAMIQASRAERITALAAAKAGERELDVARARAQDDKAAVARVGGDLARVDAQINSLAAQQTAARERRTALEQGGQAAETAAAKREALLLRQLRQHTEALAGYQRDLAACERQREEATTRHAEVLAAAWQAAMREAAEQEQAASSASAAAILHVAHVRAQAREALRPVAKGSRAAEQVLAAITHADHREVVDPLDALAAAFDRWLAALHAASGNLPSYFQLPMVSEYLGTLVLSPSTLGALLRDPSEAERIVQDRRQAVQNVRARIAEARGEQNR